MKCRLTSRFRRTSGPSCFAGWTGGTGLPQTVSESEAADHWAFHHLSPEAPGELRQPERARKLIDRYLLARLEAKGLSFSPHAERATLDSPRQLRSDGFAAQSG